MNKEKTKPAHELLLAQLILSAVIIALVGHATYEKDCDVSVYVLELHEDTNILRADRTKEVFINEFRISHGVLFLLSVSSAYFFVNLLLYITNKLLKQPILNATIIIVMQDVVFCGLMFATSIAAVAQTGDRATGIRETEILIASGVSMFCCVSSGIGVYYSFRVYKEI